MQLKFLTLASSVTAIKSGTELISKKLFIPMIKQRFSWYFCFTFVTHENISTQWVFI